MKITCTKSRKYSIKLSDSEVYDVRDFLEKFLAQVPYRLYKLENQLDFFVQMETHLIFECYRKNWDLLYFVKKNGRFSMTRPEALAFCLVVMVNESINITMQTMVSNLHKQLSNETSQGHNAAHA